MFRFSRKLIVMFFLPKIEGHLAQNAAGNKTHFLKITDHVSKYERQRVEEYQPSQITLSEAKKRRNGNTHHENSSKASFYLAYRLIHQERVHPVHQRGIEPVGAVDGIISKLGEEFVFDTEYNPCGVGGEDFGVAASLD